MQSSFISLQQRPVSNSMAGRKFPGLPYGSVNVEGLLTNQGSVIVLVNLTCDSGGVEVVCVDSSWPARADVMTWNQVPRGDPFFAVDADVPLYDWQGCRVCREPDIGTTVPYFGSGCTQSSSSTLSILVSACDNSQSAPPVSEPPLGSSSSPTPAATSARAAWVLPVAIGVPVAVVVGVGIAVGMFLYHRKATATYTLKANHHLQQRDAEEMRRYD